MDPAWDAACGMTDDDDGEVYLCEAGKNPALHFWLAEKKFVSR